MGAIIGGLFGIFVSILIDEWIPFYFLIIILGCLVFLIGYNATIASDKREL